MLQTVSAVTDGPVQWSIELVVPIFDRYHPSIFRFLSEVVSFHIPRASFRSQGWDHQRPNSSAATHHKNAPDPFGSSSRLASCPTLMLGSRKGPQWPTAGLGKPKTI